MGTFIQVFSTIKNLRRCLSDVPYRLARHCGVVFNYSGLDHADKSNHDSRGLSFDVDVYVKLEVHCAININPNGCTPMTILWTMLFIRFINYSTDHAHNLSFRYATRSLVIIVGLIAELTKYEGTNSKVVYSRIWSCLVIML